jgi:tetratricopeptide (TPR) repeat protein
MKPRLMTARIALVMLVTLIVVPAMGTADPGAAADKAQDARDRTLRDSKALLRSGNYDVAIQRLESLYATYPDDPVVASSLSGALLEAKRYERAEAVLKTSVAKRPKDPKGLTDLAHLCFVTGRKSDGLAYLEKMIRLAPEEAWAYLAAFLMLSANGAPDDAVIMVKRAREATGDSTLLARDAANIYKGLARYGAATEEYLLAGRGVDDPEMAINGIMEMAEKPEARTAIVAKLEDVAASRDLESIARGALWQIYLMDSDCGRAFGEISALARAGKLATETVRRFAARSREKGCNRQCAEVYGLALSLPENKADIPLLMLSKAECELAAGLPDQAIASYGSLVRQYPDSKWAYSADVALGRIYRERGNLDQAIAQADKVIEGASAGSARYDAIIFKGGCLVEAGKLDVAFQAYDLVETAWDKAYAQEAFYDLGEVKFYQGDFEGAVSYYNVTLREYPDEPRANDAIERLLLIKSVKGELGTIWLKEFAQGVLLERQGRVDEAREVFVRRAGEQGQGLVRIESLRRLATIAAGGGDLAGAIKLYTLVGETLDTYYSPSALEAVGDIYASQGRAPEAIQAYEQVILKYPQSVSAGEARRKIDVAKRESQSVPAGETGAAK